MGKKNIDLLFINPSARKKVYQERQEKIDYPALEPPYLAALSAEFVRSRGYEVRILDANVDNLTHAEIGEAIKDYNPKLVHIIVHGNQPSASTQLMDEVGSICRNTKALGLGVKISLSGTHPSALPKRTLLEEDCDFVIRGEGYKTLTGLLEEKPLSEIPGLWYKENGEVKQGPIDKLMSTQEMHEFLPRAAWDLLPIDKYRAHNWHCFDDVDKRQPYASIYTSFGCPFKCTFCCINAPFTEGGTVNPAIRFRDPDDIVAEIDWLVKNHGIRNVKIIDEMFVFNKKHYLGISKKLINRGHDLNLWAYARVDTVREGYLDTLKRAGFNWLGIGIESGSKHVRDGVEKGRRINEEIITDIVGKIKNAGINVGCNYIFGLPDDTMESMQQTLDLAYEVNGEWTNMYCAMAYPGSELYKLASKGILLKPKDWSSDRPVLPEDKGGPGWIGYSQHSYETLPLPTEKLYPEQVLEFRDMAHVSFYRSDCFLGMIKNKFGDKVREHVRNMVEETPKRRILGHKI